MERGMTPASTTRTFASPYIRSRESTTPNQIVKCYVIVTNVSQCFDLPSFVLLLVLCLGYYVSV